MHLQTELIVTSKKQPYRTNDKTVDFEKKLRELELLVERLEHGELSLEESLKDFERGISLSRECQKALNEAEQKVEILTKNNNKEALEPYDAGENQ